MKTSANQVAVPSGKGWLLPKDPDDIFLLCGHWTLNICCTWAEGDTTAQGLLWMHSNSVSTRAVWN